MEFLDNKVIMGIMQQFCAGSGALKQSLYDEDTNEIRMHRGVGRTKSGSEPPGGGTAERKFERKVKD